MSSHWGSLRYRWIAAVAVCSVLAICSGNIVFYHDDVVYDRFSVGPAQRCYSIACFSTKINSLRWNLLQTNSWLAYYTDDECQTLYGKKNGRNGTIAFLAQPVKSIMMLESGVYATRGVVDWCQWQERAPLTTMNGSIYL